MTNLSDTRLREVLVLKPEYVWWTKSIPWMVSDVMVSIIQNKLSLIFYEKGFQGPAPYQGWKSKCTFMFLESKEACQVLKNWYSMCPSYHSCEPWPWQCDWLNLSCYQEPRQGYIAICHHNWKLRNVALSKVSTPWWNKVIHWWSGKRQSSTQI